MLSAIYLDARYRNEILRDSELVEKAVETLINLWNRIQNIRSENAFTNESIENYSAQSSDMSIDFENSESLDSYLAHRAVDLDRNSHSEGICSGIDIKTQLELFQPKTVSTKLNILDIWERDKTEHEDLYELSSVVFAIPPTEVQIERDFSALEHVFGPRRYNLSSDLLEAVLLINLNADLFYIVKEELLEESLKTTEQQENLLSP